MNKGYIVSRKDYSSVVVRHEIYAPLIAAKAKAGNFVILRAKEGAERIPVTLVDWNAKAGTVTVIVQTIGKSTSLVNALKQGDSVQNIVGPLGVPVEIKKYGTVVCVGGGVGIAEMYPIARAFREAGNKIISVLGARTKDLVILEPEMRSVSDEVLITTDDGTLGEKGLVTNAIQKLHDRGENIGALFVIGPVIMMKVVGELTKPWNTPTFASLNPIMLDGTGMCGCCRVEVGGKTYLACVDGPMLDAHQVNFPLLLSRTRAYREAEQKCMDGYKHECNLDRAERESK